MGDRNDAIAQRGVDHEIRPVELGGRDGAGFGALDSARTMTQLREAQLISSGSQEG
ncbi:MAG: hypothetical protein ABI056_01375 [Caulobacteraceae bacterium]